MPSRHAGTSTVAPSPSPRLREALTTSPSGARTPGPWCIGDSLTNEERDLSLVTVLVTNDQAANCGHGPVVRTSAVDTASTGRVAGQMRPPGLRPGVHSSRVPRRRSVSHESQNNVPPETERDD